MIGSSVEIIRRAARRESNRVVARSCRWLALLVGAVSLGLLLSAGVDVQAAPINYGDFMGNTVTYVDVTEDSNSGDTPPLFGPPTVSGDSLDFDPVGFDANATGAGGVDVTDGNLNFMVVAKPGFGIENLSLSEAGDTTLAGFGGLGTFTAVTADGVLNISMVDGVGINVISVPFALTFVPSGGTFDLASDGGGGPLFHTFWSGGVVIDIDSILLANNISFNRGASKISVNLDNTLTALSEDGTFSLIAKKDFGGLSITTNIPEPTTFALVGLAVLGLAAARRPGSRR
jgi:hypothetical protein